MTFAKNFLGGEIQERVDIGEVEALLKQVVKDIDAYRTNGSFLIGEFLGEH